MDLDEFWTTVKNFFEGLGWFGNLVTVAGLLLAIGAWITRVVRSRLRRKEKSVRNVVARLVGDEATSNRSLLRASSAVVVDDKPDDFPLEHLRSIFKSVDVIVSIPLANWQQLQKFDWVFLDVKGVVPEEMESGGLEILTRLKASPTDQIVVAVSSKRFDPTVSDYFGRADQTLKKPITEADCDKRVAAVLERQHGAHAIAREVDELLEDTESDGDDAIRGVIADALDRKLSAKKITELLKKNGWSEASRVSNRVRHLGRLIEKISTRAS